MPDPVLSSLSSLKTHLGIPAADTSQDDALTQWLLGVDEATASYIGRERVPGYHPLQSVQATEFYDGNGRELLVLRRRPVTAVAGVWVHSAGYYGNGPTAFPDESEWDVGVLWTPQRLDASEQNGSMLVCLAGVWPEGYGNIKVTYTAGYATIPADLTLAANQFVALLRQGQEYGGPLRSETLGRYMYELLESGAANETPAIGTLRGLLGAYREIIV